MRDYLSLGEPAKPPMEYVEFTQTRAFWTELGRHREDMTMAEIAEASLFMRLEQKHQRKS